MTFYPYPIDVPNRQSADRTGRNDRLVNRFTTAGRLRVHLRLGGPEARNSRPIVADVADVSIAGALVRIPGGLRVTAGALVTLGNGESAGICRVVHATMDDDTGSQLLGLEFVRQTDLFRSDVGRAVGILRKDRGQVIQAWHRPN